MVLSDSDRSKLEKEIIRDITPEIEKRVEKRLEERMKYRFFKILSRTIEEEFMPPEEMFKKEFVEETEKILKDMESGKAKTYSLEELEAAWKKEHEI